MAFAPISVACWIISSYASPRVFSQSCESSVMLPPTMVWKPAPMVPKIERLRTMMPRTIPMLRVILKPSNWKAVVTRSWVMCGIISFHAQGCQWVDFDRAARGDPAGYERDRGHQRDGAGVGQRGSGA